MMKKSLLVFALCLAGVSVHAADVVTHARLADADAAQALAERLRSEGRTISVLTENVRWNGEAVHLILYQVRDAAELTAERLRRAGHDALVLPKREALGYMVQVGVYPDAATRDKVIEKLRAAGYGNIRARSVKSDAVVYRVQETGGSALASARKPARSEAGSETRQRSSTPPARTTASATGSATSSTARVPAKTDADISGTASAVDKTVTADTGATGIEDSGSDDSMSFGDDGEVMAFGNQTNYESLLKQSKRRQEQATSGFRLDDFRLEAGKLIDSADRVNAAHSFSARARYDLRGESWEARLGARIDSAYQGDEPKVRNSEWDYDETWFRFRFGEQKLTVGAQRIVWGGMDEMSPGNVIAAQDLTRFVLDDLSNRYRALPAVRYETWFGRFKFDAVALPLFRPAELPDRDSIWHPVDQTRGMLLGLPADPLLAVVIQNARVETDVDDDHGGGGLRLTHQGEGLDWGVSLQHVRHSTPYFQVDERVRRALLGGAPLPVALAQSPVTLQAWHPFTDVASADFAFSLGESTLRSELAWLSDVPVTGTDLRATTAPAVSIAIGFEFYPGDGNTRLSLQAGVTKIDPDVPVVDRLEVAALSGELETFFAQEAWRARLRFIHTRGEGLSDAYINPEIAFIRNEPDEFYLGAHLFEGDEGTAGAFHEHHDLLVLGWRSQF